MIPKRIIQTGKSSGLSLTERACVTNLRLLNPDFEWCFFDDEAVEAFIDTEYPEYRSVFNRFPFPIQRYDFFRYLAVYRKGGFYFDLDVLLATNLSRLISCSAVFPFEGLTLSRFLRERGIDWEIGNYAFGAAAGNPFLAEVIQNCVRAQRDPAWLPPMHRGVPPLSRGSHSVLYTTGPGLLSRTLVERPDLAAAVTVLFPKDVCDQRGWYRFGDMGVHLMNGSWRPQMPWVRRKATSLWEAHAFRKAVFRARRLGPTREVGTPNRGRASGESTVQAAATEDGTAGG
jgi:hypothetical protein